MAVVKCQVFVLLALTCCLTYGESLKGPLKRIINGFVAAPKQFPYQLWMMAYRGNGNLADCGAVLISTRMALTAAHCFDTDLIGIELYLGVRDMNKLSESQVEGIALPKDSIVVHPDWSSLRLRNDIAIIHLPYDIQLNEYIQTVQLPEADNTYDNKNVTISGFGFSKTQSTQLQFYNSTVLPRAEARSLFRKYFFLRRFRSSYILVKPNGRFAVGGDHGGPMVVTNEDGTKTLVGIKSFGNCDECEDFNLPVFTRVSSFLSWIKENEVKSSRKSD